jgi:hypothetical protein
MDVLFGFAANTFRSAAYSADGADRGMALIVTGWPSWKFNFVSDGIFTCLPPVAPW